MRMQSTEASCGAAALSNALKAVGVVRSEDEMAKLSGTNSSGTSQAGITKALKSVGREPGKLLEAKSHTAVLRLIMALQCGHPVILCVDDWEHWVVAVGLLGVAGYPRIVVVDSASLELTHVYSIEDVVSRWGHNKKKFSGVIV